MKSKNHAPISRTASAHMQRVKELPCSVCDEPAPSEAHHIRQGLHYTTVALCPSCHRGAGGWHGTRILWQIRKMDELAALDVTLARLALNPVATAITEDWMARRRQQ
jgi:hypothetical protein